MDVFAHPGHQVIDVDASQVDVIKQGLHERADRPLPSEATCPGWAENVIIVPALPFATAKPVLVFSSEFEGFVMERMSGTSRQASNS